MALPTGKWNQLSKVAAAEKNRCEMELGLLDVAITRCSETIQNMAKYQTNVYAKFQQTDQLRYRCEYNNMRCAIDEKISELQELETKYTDKEQHLRWMTYQVRIAKKQRKRRRAENKSSGSSGSSSSSPNSSMSFSDSSENTSTANSSLSSTSSGNSSMSDIISTQVEKRSPSIILKRDQALRFDGSGIDNDDDDEDENRFDNSIDGIEMNSSSISTDSPSEIDSSLEYSIRSIEILRADEISTDFPSELSCVSNSSDTMFAFEE